MGKLDLPDSVVKLSTDKLERKAFLQNWCASGFPYCCTGEITVNDDLSATCGCGFKLKPLPKETPNE